MVTAKSVKMDSEINTGLKKAAQSIGYSENQLVVEAVKALLDLADDQNNVVPKVVMLLRCARDYEAAPPQFAKPDTKLPRRNAADSK